MVSVLLFDSNQPNDKVCSNRTLVVLTAKEFFFVLLIDATVVVIAVDKVGGFAILLNGTVLLGAHQNAVYENTVDSDAVFSCSNILCYFCDEM